MPAKKGTRKTAATPKQVETLNHKSDRRKNIPTAEHRSVMSDKDQSPLQIAYERRNRDLDPQLVWRGKDEQDWSDLVVNAPPLYIQEKVHPKALIDDLLKQTKEREHDQGQLTADLFADFNGIPKGVDKTEFYQHDQNWSNRMILGDSLQVMASLTDREGLRGKVQCIYFDPPYGIKFNSNFQWSTADRSGTSTDATTKITREPEQVRAFRDTWQDGVNSYLSYLRNRFSVCRELLRETGSIFVQIGDENVHRVRSLLDEVFGEENFLSLITFRTSVGLGSQFIDNTGNYVLWYARDKSKVKARRLFRETVPGEEGASRYKTLRSPELIERRLSDEELARFDPSDGSGRLFRDQGLTSRSASSTTLFTVDFCGQKYRPSTGGWRTSESGMQRAIRADRVFRTGKNISYRKFYDDFSAVARDNFWSDVSGGITSRSDPKVYVVQTSTRVVERCVLMGSDPGDLVLDPTCGAGTSAYVAEQWGRRWITIDTSRVSLALARARIMGARYRYYMLADSIDGQAKEAEIVRSAPTTATAHCDIRHGFVYDRVPHVTLKDIANNTEIDVIWEQFQQKLEPLRKQLNKAVSESWEEWEIPREAAEDWSDEAKSLHEQWWKQRIARQHEIDASIAAKADFEYLYDKPYEDKKRVRVAGPFTVESISPHRVLGVDENDELIDPLAGKKAGIGEDSSGYEGDDFAQMILGNLKTAGVQQARKEDKIEFSSIAPWPGELICAEGRYMEGDSEAGKTNRAGIFIGPEFGTVSRPDLVAAAREAGDADFDVLIACAFNYEAHASEFEKLGRIPVLKARMNADLHMADDLKNTGKGNLFVIFGEPDIDILDAEDGMIQVKVNGVDVFHPQTGEVRSDGADGIACWFVDTDYNMESFFVRHAYFLGANDPYKSLKTTLKAEIDQEAWKTLNSDTSRPFEKPKSGRIAVKVINHLGDEVMKVFEAK